MTKKKINMLSSADSVKGQGVGSAYLEQVDLVTKGLSDEFEISVNTFSFPEITHYHTIDLKFFLTKSLMSRKGKSVGYVHMLPETVEKSLDMPQVFKKVFYWYMIKFYKSMDHLVTVNPYFIGELEKYDVPREKVTYIPNYVSSEKFYQLTHDEKMAIRKEYEIPENAFVVLSAGQLQRRKGIFDFIEMAKAMPDVHFVWAGGFSFGMISDGYKEIEKIVKNPPKNVSFLGIVDRDKMNHIYNMADVMLLASYEELFPMTILEAMSVNVPILLRDLDIYPDILFDFYVKANTNEEFIHQIQSLKDDRVYFETAAHASAKGHEFYSKESVLKMWREFYHRIYQDDEKA